MSDLQDSAGEIQPTTVRSIAIFQTAIQVGLLIFTPFGICEPQAYGIFIIADWTRLLGRGSKCMAAVTDEILKRPRPAHKQLLLGKQISQFRARRINHLRPK